MGIPAFLVSPQTDYLMVWQGSTLASNSGIYWQQLDLQTELQPLPSQNQ